uniref:Uncharacterized protein n=1 Tax=Cucumis sativus TaxID=3659 RepID=A0A0A0LM31_CUCSA
MTSVFGSTVFFTASRMVVPVVRFLSAESLPGDCPAAADCWREFRLLRSMVLSLTEEELFHQHFRNSSIEQVISSLLLLPNLPTNLASKLIYKSVTRQWILKQAHHKLDSQNPSHGVVVDSGHQNNVLNDKGRSK